MKKYLYFSFLLFTLTNCAIYTKSNVKDKSNKEDKGDLGLINYLDVKDGYNTYMVATPFLIAQQRFTSVNTYIPLGLEFYTANKNIGDFEGNMYYLAEGFNFNSDYEDLPTFNWERIRLEYRLLYAYPVWRITDQIDRYQVNIGKSGNIGYYGILPTAVDIELSIRGGYQQSMSSFVSDRFGEYMLEQEPNIAYLGYYSGDLLKFRTYNSVLKFGAIFQRKIATRFDTNIKGNSFHIASYKTNGIYADISILAYGSNTKVPVEYGYHPNGNVSEYIHTTTEVSSNQLFKKYPIGITLGYKQTVQGKSHGLATRVIAEFGLHPGYYPNIKGALYGNVGIGIGFGTRK